MISRKIQIIQGDNIAFAMTFTSKNFIGPNFETGDDRKLLDWLFQQFNRKDDETNELISVLELGMPSLSVDDMVLIDERAYVCATLGWNEVKLPR